MNVKEILDTVPYEEIREMIARLAGSNESESIDFLKEFLLYRDSHTYYKHAIPRLACLALLQKGCRGIDALLEVLPEAPGSIYPTSILEAIWYASRGELPNAIGAMYLPPIPPLDEPLMQEVQEYAHNALVDYILECSKEEEKFSQLMTFIYQENYSASLATRRPGSHKAFRESIFDIFALGRIRLSHKLVEEFDRLVQSSRREEEYQDFLSENPAFIDPLAGEVISKQRLGIECVTDFVIRRLDDKYILVEIEKPQDRIFTSGCDFSAAFTHAFGQTLDFLQWVDSHGEYARSLLPNISSPRGMLIMGRSSTLTEKQLWKLHRFNTNSNQIEVLTFDEITANARRLFTNIYGPNFPF